MKTLVAFLAAFLFALPAHAGSFMYEFAKGESLVISDSKPCTSPKALQALRDLVKELGLEMSKEQEKDLAGGTLMLQGKQHDVCWSIVLRPDGVPFAGVGASDGKFDLVPLQAFKPLTES
jgi:hypothetical protein